MGWLLWDARASLDGMRRRGGWIAAAGLLLALGLAVSPLRWHFAGRALYAFVPWLVTFGAIGLALRVRNAPRPRLRFLVEASYCSRPPDRAAPQVGPAAFRGRVEVPAVVSTCWGDARGFAVFVRGGVLGEWLGAARRPASPVHVAATRRVDISKTPS
jgi:hypothetical protein